MNLGGYSSLIYCTNWASKMNMEDKLLCFIFYFFVPLREERGSQFLEHLTIDLNLMTWSRQQCN